MRAGQRGGGQRVGEPGRAAGRDGRDVGQHPPAERPVDERAPVDAELVGAGRGERDAHPLLGGRRGQQRRRGRVVDPARPRPARAAPAPWPRRRRPSSRASRGGPRRRSARTPRRARTDGDQCSWKLDSSTASTSRPSPTAVTTGWPTLPQATASCPAARRIASSMPTVVVLPLVPVTASQRRGHRLRLRDPPRQLRLPHHGHPRARRDERVVGPPSRPGHDERHVGRQLLGPGDGALGQVGERFSTGVGDGHPGARAAAGPPRRRGRRSPAPATSTWAPRSSSGFT